jgi:hypothetical protein
VKHPIFFCDEWNPIFKEPWNDKRFTLEQARAHEATGAWYTVLVDDPVRPSIVIHTGLRDDGKRGYSVYFLDDRLRVYVRYNFRQYDKKTLFMEVATELKYHNDETNPYWGAAHVFSEDRSMFTEEGDFPPVGQERTINRYTNTYNDERFDQLFEPIPEFGEYDSLIRLERGNLS